MLFPDCSISSPEPPTGYGKSLIYQLLPYTFDSFLSSDVENSSIIVVAPLNALMQDQISKLQGHLNVQILKDPRYSVGQKAEETDSIKTSTINQFNFPPQFLLALPEVLIENKKVFTKVYREGVKAIVIDEAHLVVEWWASLFYNYFIAFIIDNECIGNFDF